MTAISFDYIPAQLRVPGVYVEINSELAGAATFQTKVLIVGQRLAGGNVAEGVQTRITDPSQAEDAWGRGSMIAAMFAAFKSANQFTETWGIALDDNGAGVVATGTLTFTGAVTRSGTLNLMIAGKRVQVAVAAGEPNNTTATNVAAAINLVTDLPVTAGAVTNAVTLTARHKGEVGNDIDIRTNYYTGEVLPRGLAVAIVAMNGGTANPDIATAIAALGDEWWNYVVMPYTDAANLTALETELDTRYQPPFQQGGRAFCAYRGAHAATGTFGETRNNPHVTCIGTGIAPQPPYIWASINAGIGSFNLANDPARPLQRLQLPGLLPPNVNSRWDWNERNLLLFDGIATFTVTDDDRVLIERQITMYRENASQVADDAYLDITTPETMERVRWDKVQLISTKYPRHKLREDGELEDIPVGSAIATPSIIAGELLAIYRSQINKGWVEDFAHYKATLVVMIGDGQGGGDRNRVNVNDQPNIVNQFRVLANKTQFIV